MQSEDKPLGSTQDADAKKKSPGRARVKLRHLSPMLRQVILDRFSHPDIDSEDIAEELRIPARTVTDLILKRAIKGPEPARPLLLRRAG